MVAFQIYYLNNKNFALDSSHDYWLALSTLVSLTSLIIDVKDVLEYLASTPPPT